MDKLFEKGVCMHTCMHPVVLECLLSTLPKWLLVFAGARVLAVASD